MPPSATAIHVLATLCCGTHPRQVVNRTGSQQDFPVGRAGGVCEGAGSEQQLGTLLYQLALFYRMLVQMRLTDICYVTDLKLKKQNMRLCMM
jgi:hypothetical protein